MKKKSSYIDSTAIIHSIKKIDSGTKIWVMLKLEKMFRLEKNV